MQCDHLRYPVIPFPDLYPGDKRAALELAEIAGIDAETYAMEMFAAASNLKTKSDEEIFYQDFKRFTAGKVSFGVGQISSLNEQELEQLQERLQPYLKKVHEMHPDVNMIFFMLTNILTESTLLLCEGSGAEAMIRETFHMEESKENKGSVELPGVVSRKKQLIPAIVMALQE